MPMPHHGHPGHPGMPPPAASLVDVACRRVLPRVPSRASVCSAVFARAPSGVLRRPGDLNLIDL